MRVGVESKAGEGGWVESEAEGGVLRQSWGGGVDSVVEGKGE